MTSTTKSGTEAATPGKIDSVQSWYEIPGKTTVVLGNEGLSKISAAIAAIRACNDLLNHNTGKTGDGKPAFCSHTAHGLLAAIACCTELIDSIVIPGAAETSVTLSGEDARKIDAQAWDAWSRKAMGKGGAA